MNYEIGRADMFGHAKYVEKATDDLSKLERLLRVRIPTLPDDVRESAERLYYALGIAVSSAYSYRDCYLAEEEAASKEGRDFDEGRIGDHWDDPGIRRGRKHRKPPIDFARVKSGRVFARAAKRGRVFMDASSDPTSLHVE